MHASMKLSNTNDIILPQEEHHGIALRCLTQVLIPITQILQCRALEHMLQRDA